MGVAPHDRHDVQAHTLAGGLQRGRSEGWAGSNTNTGPWLNASDSTTAREVPAADSFIRREQQCHASIGEHVEIRKRAYRPQALTMPPFISNAPGP